MMVPTSGEHIKSKSNDQLRLANDPNDTKSVIVFKQQRECK